MVWAMDQKDQTQSNGLGPTPNVTSATGSNANSTTANGATCLGQTITAGSSKRDDSTLDERDPELLEFEAYIRSAMVKRTSTESCDTLSQTYGVATGNLRLSTGTDDCSFNTSSICVPLKCEVAKIGNNQSW